MKGAQFALLGMSAESWRGTCCLLMKHCRYAHLCSAESHELNAPLCIPHQLQLLHCSLACNLQLSQYVVLLSCLMEGFGHHSFAINASIILLKHLN